MIKNFWDLTYRPYTQLKLRILREYLDIWARIFFSHASEHKEWASWQNLYYVDCFAGRGKYHKDGIKDIIDGSPLIALSCALKFQSDPRYKGVKMNCIFIEEKRKYSQELESFCKSYKNKINFKIYKQKDFNKVISEVNEEVNSHPTFFFIDPDGIKELKKRSLEIIVEHNGPIDILLNYIKGGVERLSGLARKESPIFTNENELKRYIKTIETLADFGELNIFKKLNKTTREILKDWTNSILQHSELRHVAVFDMPYFYKSGLIYYLLFASKKEVAKKIILKIFRKAKTSPCSGQLAFFNNEDFEL